MPAVVAKRIFGGQARARLAAQRPLAASKVNAQRSSLAGRQSVRRRQQTRHGYPYLVIATMANAIRAAAPRVTGKLRRSIRPRRRNGQWRVTSTVIYALPVDRRGKSRGYVRRGLRNARAAIKRELNRANAGHLPVPQTLRISNGRFSANVERAIADWTPQT